ncbi:ABC transporter ATP-binding protein [Enterococcus olivae]
MVLLKIDHISYVSEKKFILKDVFLEVEKGECLTISGPSGSGKSTLLKMIASLVTPSSGEIYLNDKAQSEFQPHKYRQKVSYCFQQPVLFGETVRDNLLFPFTIRKEVFDEKKAVGLLEKVMLSASFLDQKITSLSGGEKQRVALIRHLLFLPEVLLLDEVTAGLDDENKEIIHQLIDHLKDQGVTILQITHDSTELAKAEKVVRMDGGKLYE